MTQAVTDSQADKMTQPFREHAGSVLRTLRTAISALLASIPGADGAKTATDLQRALRINGKLSWQLHKLLNASDVVTVGSHVPKSAAMKRFLDQAVVCGASMARVQEVKTAMQQFDELVAQHAGDRLSYDSMIGALAGSDTSAQSDLQHRRTAFRAQSHIFGLQAKTRLSCYIAQPSANDSTQIDMVSIRGLVGIRQLRQDAPWILTMGKVDRKDRTGEELSVVGEPLDERGQQPGVAGAGFLVDFCSQPLPEIRNFEDADGWVRTELVNNTIGNQGAVTSILGEVMREADGRYRDVNNELLEFWTRIRKPFEVVVADFLVREGTYGDKTPTPEAFVINDADERPVRPLCDRGRLPCAELAVAYLGKGADVLHSPDVPRYPEMAQYVFDRLGWEGQKFDVYRCRLEYPVMPSTLVMTLPLPEKP